MLFVLLIFFCVSELEHNKLHLKDNSNKKMTTLEDYFFDLECAMDKNNVCRDLVCIEVDKEKGMLLCT